MLQVAWQCGLVALGGAVGAVARFLSTRLLIAVWPAYIGAGTLAVNVLGSFAIGWALGAAVPRNSLSDDWRIFLVTGLFGGFTTFSALTYETSAMWTRHGGGWQGWVHLAANVVLGLIAVVLGRSLNAA